MKNEKKNCVMCSNIRGNKTSKICHECVKIKLFIHKYGMDAIQEYIDKYKIEKKTLRSNTIATAPPY